MSSTPPTIGFFGGHSVYELGPPADVEVFFACLKTYLPPMPAQASAALLTDRLYRRYLTLEQLEPAMLAMAAVRARFADIPLATASAAAAKPDPASRMAWGGSSLADVFATVFQRFEDAVGSARSFHDEFGLYQAVRLVIADMPQFMVDKKRPLPQYDSLDGAPFWRR